MLQPHATPGAADRSPAVQMLHMLYGSLVTQLITVVAELGIADLLGEESQPIDELADKAGAEPEALYRVMRALASLGVFTETAHRTFGLTPLAATLRTDAAGSMREQARYFGLRERQRAFIELTHTVRTGEPAFEHLYGSTWWSHLAANPGQAAMFNDAMGDVAREVHAAAIEAYDLSGVRRLVDIGGGHGHLVARILRHYPDMSAAVLDQPRVVADSMPAGADVAARMEWISGDFFECVPEGADAYVLSWILHDWSDADAARILTNVRNAMKPGGIVIIIDTIIPDGDTPSHGKLVDIVMLALLHGRERTEREFSVLLESAGLRHVDTRGTSAPTSLIIASPQ